MTVRQKVHPFNGTIPFSELVSSDTVHFTYNISFKLPIKSFKDQRFVLPTMTAKQIWSYFCLQMSTLTRTNMYNSIFTWLNVVYMYYGC